MYVHHVQLKIQNKKSNMNLNLFSNSIEIYI